MIKRAELNQVFIINLSNLEELGDRRCFVCGRQVSIGDVVVRVSSAVGVRAFHADCFRARKHHGKKNP